MTDKTNSLAPRGESLAEYVNRLRTFRGISKTELAKRAEVHLTTITRLEGGAVSGTKLKTAVQHRIARALQIPVDFLQAAATGLEWELITSEKICPNCWVPSTPPDSRWNFADAKFCLKCSTRLLNSCPCGHEINPKGKFCAECGKSYKNLLSKGSE